MSENKEIPSILDMVQGGVKEIVNENVADILLNIQDPNTGVKPRKLSIEITFTPLDERRKKIALTYGTTKKLQPIKPIATTIYAGVDGNGELTAMELTEEISGQMKIDGSEAPKPVIINFTKKAVNK